MQVLREVLRVKVGNDKERELWDKLKGLYQPLVGDLPATVREMLDLEAQQVNTGGELFLGRDDNILFYWVSEEKDSVEAGVIYSQVPPLEPFEEFRSSIASVLDAWRWTPMSILTRRFRLVAEESEPFPVTKGQLEAAQVLTTKECRDLLQKVGGSPGFTISGVGDEDDEALSTHVDSLVLKGLLEREFEVFDRESNRELARFPNYEALQDAAERGFRSPFSNRLISEERIDQILRTTPLGKRLAHRNLWLALSLAGALSEQGVSEKSLRWSLENDYETVDLFASYEGSVFMFEVQENRVSSDKAFRFVSRAKYFEPDAAFLVSPGGCSREAECVLERSDGDISMDIISDLSTLGEKISEVLKDTSYKSVQEILGRFDGLTKINLGSVVGEHLLGPEPQVSEQSDISALLDLDFDLDIDSGSESVGEDDLLSDDSLNEALDVDSIGGDVPLDDFASELAALDLPSESTTSSSTSDLDLDLDLDFDLDLDLDLGDLDIGTTSESSISEMLPEVESPVEKPSISEALSKLAEDLNTSFSQSELDFAAIGSRLKDYSDSHSGTSVGVVTQEGLEFSGSGGDEVYQRAAAINQTVVELMSRGTDEAELGTLKSLHIEAADKAISFHGLVNEMNLLAISPSSLTHDTTDGSDLPGESVLREAIMKKVLEELSGVEGVLGNVVTSSDGLPIDMQLPEDINPEVVGVIMTQAVGDCEQEISFLGLKPVHQYLLVCESRSYSLIPIDSEAYLITFLTNDVAREIWQNRLTGAASMLASVFQ